MPISNVEQPQYIALTDTLRLRKYDGCYDFALKWYQDEETLWLVNHSTTPYDKVMLEKMYTYLDTYGELYFIEGREGETFVPIGDVTFSQEDMPIVIGDPHYRGKGIGKQVIKALINRAQEIGYSEIKVEEIYTFNTASQKLFESCGFKQYETTPKGYRYKLVAPTSLTIYNASAP